MIFKRIGIVSRNHDTDTMETIALLKECLEKENRCVFFAENNPLPTENKVSENSIAEAVDLIIAVGGDGTILHAANLAQSQDVPLLGINRGKLGFLADILPSEMLTDITEVINGNYTTEPRMMLEAMVIKSDGNKFVNLALNDIVIQRIGTGRMLDFNTSIAILHAACSAFFLILCLLSLKNITNPESHFVSLSFQVCLKFSNVPNSSNFLISLS